MQTIKCTLEEKQYRTKTVSPSNKSLMNIFKIRFVVANGINNTKSKMPHRCWLWSRQKNILHSLPMMYLQCKVIGKVVIAFIGSIQWNKHTHTHTFEFCPKTIFLFVQKRNSIFNWKCFTKIMPKFKIVWGWRPRRRYGETKTQDRRG